MRRYALIAALLLAPTLALAQDAPGGTVLSPQAEAATAPQTATTAPAPPPTHWQLDLDAGDLQTLNAAVMELPKKVADPFIAKLQSHLKPQP